MAEKGKISRNPEELETKNLVDIFNVGEYFVAPPRPLQSEWDEEFMPEKKGDLRRPVIPIHIGAHTFDEAVCNLRASVNIMPKVIYEKIHGPPLLYTTMHLQHADQMLCYPMGILENMWVVVGQLSLRVDFVVIESRGDERAPIILGRPFLSAAKVIIYTNSAKIYFTIRKTKERFSFKNRTLTNRVHPQRAYDRDYKIQEKRNVVPENKIPQKKAPTKKKVNTYEGILPTPPKNIKKVKSKAKLPTQEPVWMVKTIEPPTDPALAPSQLEKLEDPRVPTIDLYDRGEHLLQDVLRQQFKRQHHVYGNI